MLEREFSNSVIINIVGKNTDKELDDALHNLSFCFYNKNVQFLDAAFMQTSTTSIPSEPATTAAVAESTTRQTASPALETPSESCQASCPEVFSFWNFETSCPAHCVSRNRRESSTCELVEKIQNVEMQDGCVAENLRLKVCAGICNDVRLFLLSFFIFHSRWTSNSTMNMESYLFPTDFISASQLDYTIGS
jgi:hypothetical protein